MYLLMTKLKKELNINNNDSEWLYKNFPIQKKKNKSINHSLFKSLH